MTITLDCGCSIALIADGEFHHPETLLPCLKHSMLLVAFGGQLAGAQVRVVNDAGDVLSEYVASNLE